MIDYYARIHNAPLSESAKFPYLLLSRFHFTVVIIQQAHAVQLHSGVNAMLTMLHQQYWIPSAQQKNQINYSQMCSFKEDLRETILKA